MKPDKGHTHWSAVEKKSLNFITNLQQTQSVTLCLNRQLQVVVVEFSLETEPSPDSFWPVTTKPLVHALFYMQSKFTYGVTVVSRQIK